MNDLTWFKSLAAATSLLAVFLCLLLSAFSLHTILMILTFECNPVFVTYFFSRWVQYGWKNLLFIDLLHYNIHHLIYPFTTICRSLKVLDSIIISKLLCSLHINNSLVNQIGLVANQYFRHVICFDHFIDTSNPSMSVFK